jgi:hypothetical protein
MLELVVGAVLLFVGVVVGHVITVARECYTLARRACSRL